MKFNFLIKEFVFLLGITILLSSCGKSMDIGEKDQLKLLNAAINEKLPKGSLVTYINISCTTDASVGWNIQKVSLKYINTESQRRSMVLPIEYGSFYDEEDKSPASYSVPTKGLKNGKLVDIYPPECGRDIENYDFSHIADDVQKAKNIAAEKGFDHMTGVDDYTILLYKDPSLDTRNLTLLKKVENLTKLSGKKITTSYHVFKFNIDYQGNIKDNIEI